MSALRLIFRLIRYSVMLYGAFTMVKRSRWLILLFALLKTMRRLTRRSGEPIAEFRFTSTREPFVYRRFLHRVEEK